MPYRLDQLIKPTNTYSYPEQDKVVEEINELKEKKTEIFHGKTHKFTVVNYQNRYGDNKLDKSCNLSKTDPEVHVINEKLEPNFFFSLSDDQLEEEKHEKEDLFETGPTNNNEFHINYAKYRESEGQDTITSLSKHAFKKLAWNKKHSTSTNTSTKDFYQEDTNENVGILDSQDARSISSDLNILNGSISSLRPVQFTDTRTLFGQSRNNSNSICSSSTYRTSNTSIHNELKRNRLIEFIKSDTQSLLTARNSINNEISIEEAILLEAEKVCSPETEQNSKSDQVFLVLKDAIDNKDSLFLEKNFINEVINTLKYQERKEKKHRDNVRKMCRFFELLVFFLITVMTIFLIHNVFFKLKMIHEIGSRSSYRLHVNLGEWTIRNTSDFFEI